MCGIAGIFNLAEAPAPTEGQLRSMLAQIRHRGPDEFGIYLADGIGLGNARLSIVDLAGGSQPISNEAGDVWIVYNGEVFNHVELRAELEAKGHVFATHTDTEVIVHLYEEHGPACLRRLNGQWAIAIWDARSRQLLLARDRLGVRPLFFTQAAGVLLFGSEVKAIFADPRVCRSLDPIGISQVFTYWTSLAPRTCFAGVQQLPPGHFMLVRDGTIRVERYWALDYSASPDSAGSSQKPPRTERATVEAFRELLIDAARLRLRADVPVGAYLSGGLDSSVIAAMIRHIGVQKLDTFSISFSDPEFDESGPQVQMARFLGTQHQVVHATHADIAYAFPDVIRHVETPLTRTAPVPMYLLSRLAHQHNYKVVLTGEGADEFLGGYDIFKEDKIRRFWAREPSSKRRPLLFQKLYPEINRVGAASPAFISAFFGADLGETSAPDYSHRVRWRNNRRSQRFFSADFRARLPDTAEEIRLPDSFPQWGPLQRAQFLETDIFMSGYLLSSQGDRPAMAHAVEGRYPFLDYRVVEFCNALPASMKLRVLREKWLLREAFKGWLPDDILQRRKRPYRAPIYRCFAGSTAPEYVHELFDPASLARTGIFDPKSAHALYSAVSKGRTLGETDEMALLGIISTELLQGTFVGFHPNPPLGTRERVKVVYD